ncbi:NAD(P)H-dependent oxidoreductase [Leuconostocaceae bacterium ESL0958]|nr:NAD(P)H-dependent oxidoreductase [Leuconostocaceae bacterium ESL0958]
MQKKVALLVGSNRTQSVSRQIAHWAQPLLSDDSVLVDILDLAAIDLPWLDEPALPASGHYQKASTLAWSEQVQRYDALVIICPQYNWGYPAVLKNALDTLYQEWQGLPVATICFGGHGGTQAAIALELVLKGLHVDRLAVNPSLSIPVEAITPTTTPGELAAILAPYRNEMVLLAADVRGHLWPESQ